MKIISVNPKTEAGTASTVTVEINGVVRDLPAHVAGEYVTIYGLAIRYQTGSKVWPGEALYWPANGHINNVRGPQDHRQRKHELSIVGFWSDFQGQIRSEHSSVRGRA